MKKVLSILLAFVMVLSLAACVADPQPSTNGKTDPTNKPSAPTTAPTDKPTEPTTAPTEPKNDVDIGFPETVIAENNDCLFKIVSITSDDLYYTLKVYLENKSSVSQMFHLGYVSVNDYMCDPLWACELAAGLKQYSEVKFLRAELDAYGITDPTKLEFYLSIYDNEGWDAKEFFGQICTIYPQGEEKHVDDGGYTAQEGDTVLVDNENVTAIIIGFDPNGFFGYTVNLYLENKTDKNLTFSADDVTVNNLMLDPWWSTELAAGKRSYSDISWFANTLERYQIGDVTVIDFLLSATDPMDWESVDFANAHCTVYPMGEEAAKSYERETQESDIVLLDNEYVTVTVVGIDPNGMIGYTVNLFIENKSEINLRVDADDVSVNGFSLDPWWATTVSAGKCCYASINWFTSDLEYNGITKVESIVMTLKIYDENAWEPFTTDTVTINP